MRESSQGERAKGKTGDVLFLLSSLPERRRLIQIGFKVDIRRLRAKDSAVNSG